MSTSGPLTESVRGYLSEESKRRFTLVAGILGAAFFLAQFVLPMLVMFLIMMPATMGQDLRINDLEQAALWRDEMWFVQRTVKADWRAPGTSATTLALRSVKLADLSEGPALPLETGARESSPALLPVGDGLWVIGAETVSLYQGGALTRLSAGTRPPQGSRPFVYGGVPAVISLATPPAVVTLHLDGGRLEWRRQEISLALPPEAGSLRALQAVEAEGRLYLFAQLCTEVPERCSLRYRELQHGAWLPLAEDTCSCARWTALAQGPRPAVFLSERGAHGPARLSIVEVTESGPRTEPIQPEGKSLAWTDWRAFPLGSRLLLASQGMPDGLRLQEVADGRVVRSMKKPPSFPFGPNVMLLMLVPQTLPILLSLLLAFLLTLQMRRHRVAEYAAADERTRFASLWQRALAQVVDVLPVAAGLLVPMAAMWRMFSDPDTFFESGPFFPLKFFGFLIAGFLWSLAVLAAYSYTEGRWGKTPGKWLVGIRVLGTDLRPCGFGRAALRNLLTFVDGFFNFLVGTMMVALTENWQRLGDLAARTIVVADHKPT